MATLVIINGFAGAGKSTVAKEFAKKYNFVLIKQDTFLFELNAIKEPKKGLTEEEHILTIKNMMSCVKNYMKYRKNIIIEGALVSISHKDPLDVRKFIHLGKKNGYKVKVIMLVAKDNVRHRRMKKKRNIVPKKIDTMLKSAGENTNAKIKKVAVLDTSDYSRKMVLKKLEKIILQKKTASS